MPPGPILGVGLGLNPLRCLLDDMLRIVEVSSGSRQLRPVQTPRLLPRSSHPKTVLQCEGYMINWRQRRSRQCLRGPKINCPPRARYDLAYCARQCAPATCFPPSSVRRHRLRGPSGWASELRGFANIANMRSSVNQCLARRRIAQVGSPLKSPPNKINVRLGSLAKVSVT